MASLGAFVSAAERFKKIHEWDLVIELYAAAGRREDALEVLNRELEQKPDHPRLLCALGDLRDDATLHERAWTKSECRDWRAARSLARRHMNKGRWSEACAWYDETVRSRRPAVLRRLHAVDARRLRESSRWVVYFSILSRFGP